MKTVRIQHPFDAIMDMKLAALMHDIAVTRACHDTWRELAAVAGLALVQSYWSMGMTMRGMDAWEVPLSVLHAFGRHLGWEAPDA